MSDGSRGPPPCFTLVPSLSVRVRVCVWAWREARGVPGARPPVYALVRGQMFAALVSAGPPARQSAVKCLMMVDVDDCLLLVLIKYLVGSEWCV